MKDKIDTQGMGGSGFSSSISKPNPPLDSWGPNNWVVRTVITPEERAELKQIINEVLDERGL